MLEFSVGTDAEAQQQGQWLIYVDDDSYVLHDRLLGLLSRYDPRAPHYFGRPLQEDKLPLNLTPTRSLTLTLTLSNPNKTLTLTLTLTLTFTLTLTLSPSPSP